MSEKTFEELISNGNVEEIAHIVRRDFHKIKHQQSFGLLVSRFFEMESDFKKDIKKLDDKNGTFLCEIADLKERNKRLLGALRVSKYYIEWLFTQPIKELGNVRSVMDDIDKAIVEEKAEGGE